MISIVLWTAVGVFGGSTVAFVVVYAWDEWQWRRIERQSRRAETDRHAITP